MSESDRELGGFPPDEPDEVYFAAARAVWKLLDRDRPLWPSLIKTARSLIVDQGRSLALANSMELIRYQKRYLAAQGVQAAGVPA